jgi:hypothetical protein
VSRIHVEGFAQISKIWRSKVMNKRNKEEVNEGEKAQTSKY